MGIIGTPLNSRNLKPSWELQADEEIVRVGKYGKVYEDDAIRSFGASVANEGWAPSSFKSQRSNRTEVVTKEARSLMDDRDVSEANKASILSIRTAYDQNLLEIGSRIVNRLWGNQLRANVQTRVSCSKVLSKSAEVALSVVSLSNLADVFWSAGIVRSDDIIISLPSLPLNYVPTGISSKITRASGPLGNAPKITPNLDHESVNDLKLSDQQALQALSGFMPFKNIPVKHDSYMSYLKYYAGQISELPDIDESWEEEFFKAASFFKPLISELSARFTRPSEVQLDLALGQGLPKVNQIQDLITAGRESYWRPTSLLCKRFSVDDPPSAAPISGTFEIAATGSVAEITLAVDRGKCQSVFNPDDSLANDNAEVTPALGTKRSIRPRASDFM